MNASFQRRMTGLGVAVILTAFAAAGYTFRSHLANSSVWLRAAFGAGEGDTMTRGAGETMVPMDLTDSTPGASARAEISIDPRRQQLIGVRTVAVARQPLVRTIRSVGVVAYDETKLVDVNLKLDGWIQELYVDYTGKLVRTGDPLFTLYSPELLTTQNEYLLALKTRDQLRASQVADAREYAERMVDAARDRLVLWDLSPGQIASLETTRAPEKALVFHSPADGYVVEKQAMEGMHVTAGDSLYQIADLSTVWVEADLYERELAAVRVGASAAVMVDAYPDERFGGQVVYIYPYVEERTRTVKVRFELPNPRGRLKPGMYANVEFTARVGIGLTVPRNALLDSGTQRVVFVSQGDGYFEPRDVTVGQRLGEMVEIVDGVAEGELVATGATFFIDSESQLRAALQGFEPVPGATASGAPDGERLDITFHSRPDPPASGTNEFEVAVRDRAGQPIEDAEVTVVFFMAAMPTMNMPAMKTETPLLHIADGQYRGTGDVMMAGRWQVSVLVVRDGQRIGDTQLTVVAP